ncbi:hypothetical protein EOD42_25430 [Rhodovarius crocodyli]|uniref:Uncharacterized protein n=1 Tax=Rhodovarius crocodyli TaxID=1979269 RepID=A0A437LV90_9PROT|nr:hypothetical protein [Rhodovarius crocodyli]RVT89287.1 hypothetical protein EOD42_25430 [Rhodovarius crocodyli]
MSFLLVIFGMIPAGMLFRDWATGWGIRLFLIVAALANWWMFYSVNKREIAEWWRLCRLGYCFG